MGNRLHPSDLIESLPFLHSFNFQSLSLHNMSASPLGIIGGTSLLNSSYFATLEKRVISTMICMVDNYANGIVEKPLTMAEFKEGVKKNEKVVESVLDWMLEHFVVPHRQ